MSGAGELLEAARASILAAGFAYAAAADVRTREVSDSLWQILGGGGVVLGAVELGSGGTLPVALWLVVGAFALEHLLPWDEAFGPRFASKVPAVELAIYAVVLAVVAGSAYRWGIGPSAVPLEVLAAVVSVVLARVLFEAGVLYGGADAKALIVAGVLVPLFPSPLILAPPTTTIVLRFLPFAVTVLTNAALLSIAAPLAIAARNAVRGEFSFPRGFTSYTLAVDELPHRFVWVRDRSLGEDTLVDDAESSEDDLRRRTEIATRLREQGVRRVWVTPQLPFLVLMAAGAFSALLFGNLLLDLFALL